MSTLKNHLSQELEENDTTPIPHKKQKLDTIPLDNNNNPIEKSIETLEIPDENEQNYTISEEIVLDILNTNYVNPDFIRRFCFAFKKNQTFTHETSQAVIYNSPFPAALLPNIFDNEFLSNVKDEIKELDFDHKSNDLYDFYQSLDLKTCEKPHLSKLRDTIYSGVFIRTMSDLVGIDLDYTPDLSAHKYGKGNYLLCHDDDIKDDDFMHGRRIAFIIYLVDEDWSKEDGGALELFNIDSQGHPNEITLSVTPKWNTMAFFALSPTSFHQVSEVISSTKIRYSISGWFHGPLNTRLSRADFLSPTQEDFDLRDIISPVYLNEKNKQRILNRLQKDSYVLITGFLRDDVFEKMIKSIKETGWEELPTGPPFIRKYHLLKNSEVCDFEDFENINIKEYKDSSTSFCKYVYEFFRSKTFANYLNEISNWQVTGIASEFRQFQSSNYTVIHDQAQDRIGVDVTLFCIEGQWDEKWEGGTHYVAEEHELLAIYPQKNMLSIVIRTSGTLKFVKCINSHVAFPRTEMSFIFWDEEEGEEKTEEAEEIEDVKGVEDAEADQIVTYFVGEDHEKDNSVEGYNTKENYEEDPANEGI
ncbi:Oxoglutarate and iron-dependent oxygenase degradation C-term-domain-containing protein [Glomus cerebriforme]|uniref:Oxoglutarate and iron-dependent oxygenase degradation C-term-domain-containing protein n=1 Tax=Glomus cerebriforme TaxID=658196 RepID=A0A397T803_9GLOM|nr:Oxoglutarate and iron-dependent oxygenase degradation C-term-domain-containing protein [Glomus cerebriforme]RIA92465.1 Oxoglutarate and iron-dependent oxygenase degradation C-term-domain-containing protein [Glomus cerebriforme]